MIGISRIEKNKFNKTKWQLKQYFTGQWARAFFSFFFLGILEGQRFYNLFFKFIAMYTDM